MYVSFPNYDRVNIHQTQYNALTAQLLLYECHDLKEILWVTNFFYYNCQI